MCLVPCAVLLNPATDSYISPVQVLALMLRVQMVLVWRLADLNLVLVILPSPSRQGRIKSLPGPRALNNVVGCGCELDALLFM
jgi:hypothetical protein